MNNKDLDEFIAEYQLNKTKGISVVTVENLSQLKSAGYIIENLFQHLCDKYDLLLHGSRTDISDTHLKPNPAGKSFGANIAAIAIMRAIISNRGLTGNGLEYPYFIDKNHPLEVKIHGINDETIGEKGFIYVLNQKDKFENEPKGSWQYVCRNGFVPISAKVEVIRSDFTHPIYDVTNNKRIQ